MLYYVTHWKRDPDGRGFSPVDNRWVGSLRVARLLAVDRLEPVVTTRALYHEDKAKADWIGIVAYKRGIAVSVVQTVYAPVEIVPSAGELGYW